MHGVVKACLHVARISRVLQQTGGHALLIGVGGSGKQSLAKLSIYMTQLAPAIIVMRKGYGINDFKVDLQAMFHKAGVKGQGVGFLFTGSQIIEERFMVRDQCLRTYRIIRSAYLNNSLVVHHLFPGWRRARSS